MEVFSNPGNNTTKSFGFYIGPLINARPRLFTGFATEKEPKDHFRCETTAVWGCIYELKAEKTVASKVLLDLDIAAAWA